MVDRARGAAGVDHAGHYLPAFTLRHGKKAVHLRGVAPAHQDFLAPVDDKTAQPSGVAGKGMGFVKNPRKKNPGHAAPFPPPTNFRRFSRSLQALWRRSIGAA